VQELITATQVARMLSLTKPEVYRLARAGRLPSVRFGAHAVRFRPQDVDRFISAHLRYDDLAVALDGGAA
jgi:excisionase family DNA binding protein